MAKNSESSKWYRFDDEIINELENEHQTLNVYKIILDIINLKSLIYVVLKADNSMVLVYQRLEKPPKLHRSRKVKRNC